VSSNADDRSLASFESQLSPGLLGLAVGVSTACEHSIGLDFGFRLGCIAPRLFSCSARTKPLPTLLGRSYQPWITACGHSIGLDCMPAKHFRGITFAAKASALLDTQVSSNAEALAANVIPRKCLAGMQSSPMLCPHAVLTPTAKPKRPGEWYDLPNSVGKGLVLALQLNNLGAMQPSLNPKP
jgi:hypothetical protein